jgi:hypothetical protein
MNNKPLDTPARPVLITHIKAKKIAQRISEILAEPFSEERVYQWRAAGKIRCFTIGSSVAARDDTLVEDLTGQRAA